jgi:hypothetical protein
MGLPMGSKRLRRNGASRLSGVDGTTKRPGSDSPGRFEKGNHLHGSTSLELDRMAIRLDQISRVQHSNRKERFVERNGLHNQHFSTFNVNLSAIALD